MVHHESHEGHRLISLLFITGLFSNLCMLITNLSKLCLVIVLFKTLWSHDLKLWEKKNLKKKA